MVCLAFSLINSLFVILSPLLFLPFFVSLPFSFLGVWQKRIIFESRDVDYPVSGAGIGVFNLTRCFPRPITAWIVLECLWDLYFTELAIYLAHLLLHRGHSWLTALATYGFIYLFFRVILLIFGYVKIKLTVNYISDNEKTNSWRCGKYSCLTNKRARFTYLRWT